ncbi:Stk1 family PASTA domain-containing Ser/Thr kinase [Sporolactobacillus pectinivorans]|uniref:Stk1 family PASTA domain-containing Ser/Thr kinase n=1 Tax=Sporolactobacillus pectinivorans TaxID=1591408 RepID=UPI000C265624|nr:Stk1 family PASTA domain-containing Ser/Thr kinase [Sporolactobacillus pectinivorans]
MIGRRIGGRYEIMSRLGEGGMAIVYKAKDLILDRLVAVKILRTELATDEEFIKRFHREAESVAALSHPNIVAIYDIGEEEDCYYIVMEYIHGMSLKEFIRDYSPISVSESVHIMKQATLAISHAHAHGIVHRDIKPHNILIDEKEHVKVTDFGIAMAVSSATITYTHSILGSAHYLSPEQARGGRATVKSDIYALGIVMFELLTGRLPFPGTSPVSVALKHLSEPMPYPTDFRSDIPQSLENVIIRSLAKNPLDRYENVVAMYDDLRTALNPERANEKRLFLNSESESTDDDERTIKMAPVGMEDRMLHEQLPPDLNKNKKGKKKSKAKKWLTFSGILLLLIAAGLFIGLVLLPKILYVNNVQVPNVSGKTIAQARQLIESKNLNVIQKNQSGSSVKKGTIISQYPAAKTEVKEGTSVTLFVSTGPKKVKVDSSGNSDSGQNLIQVDNYVGYDHNDVEKSLHNSGYKSVVWYTQQSSTVPAGEIMSQTPAAGNQVVPGDTILELTYSTGNPQVIVPDLRGKTTSEANQLLKDQGLSADFSVGDYSDTVKKGDVLGQNPPSGSSIVKGSTVIVLLSKGSQAAPKEVDKPIKVVYVGNGNGNGGGLPAHVQIYYTDANHNNVSFANEEITQTKTYTIPFTINPGQQGSYQIVIDGVQKQTGTVDYPK